MRVIAIQDKNYPKLLRTIGRDAPKRFYCKGDWPFDVAQGKDDIFKDCLAVVGSRQMTSYGRQVTDEIVTEVAAAGLTIVSGFMYGIDAQAHKAALKAGGRTIAVMPCGIDLIHPEYQQDLYRDILDNQGLVISEYEGTFQPFSWTYPRRNRIVAGLSKATLVIEAGDKSGSLVTANFARKFDRKVFAVPGPVTSQNSKGIMQLFKEGAEAVASAKDILDFYKIKTASAPRSGAPAEKAPLAGREIEGRILEKLKTEQMNADELARAFGAPVSELGVRLSMMELRGLIRQEGSKYCIS